MNETFKMLFEVVTVIILCKHKHCGMCCIRTSHKVSSVWTSGSTRT